MRAYLSRLSPLLDRIDLHVEVGRTYAWMAGLSAAGPRVRVLKLEQPERGHGWGGSLFGRGRLQEIDLGFLFGRKNQVAIAVGGQAAL